MRLIGVGFMLLPHFLRTYSYYALKLYQSITVYTL